MEHGIQVLEEAAGLGTRIEANEIRDFLEEFTENLQTKAKRFSMLHC